MCVRTVYTEFLLRVHTVYTEPMQAADSGEADSHYITLLPMFGLIILEWVFFAVCAHSVQRLFVACAHSVHTASASCRFSTGIRNSSLESFSVDMSGSV